jgi:hypothetical protein
MNLSKTILTTVAAMTALCGFSVLADETGTKVSIRAASETLPDAQKVVDALLARGDEHLVRATRHKSQEQEELTLELWGSWMPSAQIQGALRDGFPALAAAEIQVSPLDSSAKPKLDPADLDQAHDGKVMKKIIKRIEKK